ncbi:adenosylcobinamide-phosphate synthase [Variovorax paradoxus]|uniref:Cobalamin biosynthesis protein CobD n=1 Tax=Variovorax paradoxus TaxID=34073 RepID=A0AAE4C0M7_VARPD|nr:MULTISPECIES: adenosylcobinamide-phosphate synthase CbiB [Variovorax]MBD9665067.1 cobalamin biosynthesis protein CobD [Variovorax sp. VRV01]MDP9967257.1 adenosylcobinamide-phosphate synthase [Variovorax paradoxus]MDR6429334.1 adenosylcobinamide-phosphate synthase [Variovorax paradoxus]MDR6455328.1 adenosylcobinamide-phosphate synthase [Variovorax paradoxus]
MPAVAALWLALAIDRWLGEPAARWHPVVWMGRYLGWIGSRMAPRAADARPRDLPLFLAGALAWGMGAVLVGALALAVEGAALWLPRWAAAVVLALVLKSLFAWRMLRAEVLAVDAALAVSLESGRAQLARLVSRDVSALSECEVRESAIESLAENLNDSLVAPLFWFVLLGLPGAAVYRFANTADAMWGYRGERNGRDWTWFGKWAARADDVLSWLPARLTVLLLALAAWRWPRGVAREAQRTPSPNSGWPMAAMALLLGVRLAKPGVYALNAEGRPADAADTQQAAQWGGRAVLATAACASLAIFFAAIPRA